MLNPNSRWSVKRPVWTSIGLGLIPVVCTAVGSALAQQRHADDATSYLMIAGAVVISAVIGLLIMVKAAPTLADFGFRTPRNPRAVLWLAPPALTVLVVLATGGVHVDVRTGLSILALTVAVGINEEVFFRGLILSALRTLSTKKAVVGSSILFGVLHLAGAAGGSSPLYSALQVFFAALFGWVAAQIVLLTGSLRPAIAWHTIHDTVSYLGGDVLNAATITGAVLNCLVLTATGVVLWRRLSVSDAAGPLATASPASRSTTFPTSAVL